VEFRCRGDDLYSRECDRGIRCDEPSVGVQWGEVARVLLSPKDAATPLLKDSDCNFIYARYEPDQDGFQGGANSGGDAL